jgi:protein-tyrosine phosphatase
MKGYKAMKKRITFVCTGNTCRSPMAEAFFNHMLNEREELKASFEGASAGVYAFEGDPASQEARAVMEQEFGISLKSHRARVLDIQDIRGSWLILTMTRHHKEMILDIYPEGADKVFTLKEYAQGENADIIDPFGFGEEVYKDCSYDIEACILDLFEKLKTQDISF